MSFIIFLIGFMVTIIVAMKKHLNPALAIFGSLLFWPGVLIYALCVNKKMFKHYIDALTFASMEFPNATDAQKVQVATYVFENVYTLNDLEEARCKFSAYK